jgi:hypothetical protein
VHLLDDDLPGPRRVRDVLAVVPRTGVPVMMVHPLTRKLIGNPPEGSRHVSERDAFIHAFLMLSYADPDGSNVWPSERTQLDELGWKYRRKVQQSIENLERQGYLVADGIGKNKVRRWRFVIPGSAQAPACPPDSDEGAQAPACPPEPGDNSAGGQGRWTGKVDRPQPVQT